MIALLALLLSAGLQDQPPIPIRPGMTPPGTSAVPITEVAEPMALALAGFDANDDAFTSRAELEAGLRRTFAAADTNRDGGLGYIEYSGWATTWLGSQNALPGPFSLDADGDDRISQAEFLGEFGRQFARLDANGDAAVSHAELLTVRNPRSELRPPRRQQQRLDPQRRGRRN